MENLSELLASVRQSEKLIRNQAMRFVVGNLSKSTVRNTHHYNEWFRVPMNYARIMELPLTMRFLDAKKDDAILDVSSPKLLSLYYALNGYDGVVAADLEDYFVEDFEAYNRLKDVAIQTAVFDAAKKIPYKDDHFDKIFSVSVLEHIPDDGDSAAIQEMLRVLKPDGTMVVTLPAFSHYVEEWTSTNAYWRSVKDDVGKTFFQRRYDAEALKKRFSSPNREIAEILLVAENPVEQPRLDSSGRMLHNSYYIETNRLAHVIKGIARRLTFIPFMNYLAEYVVSRDAHYLTKDWSDPNIRQVVVKMKKVVADPLAGSA